MVYYKRFNYLFYFICKFGGSINKRWFFFFACQGFQSFMHTPICESCGRRVCSLATSVQRNVPISCCEGSEGREYRTRLVLLAPCSCGHRALVLPFSKIASAQLFLSFLLSLTGIVPLFLTRSTTAFVSSRNPLVDFTAGCLHLLGLCSITMCIPSRVWHGYVLACTMRHVQALGKADTGVFASIWTLPTWEQHGGGLLNVRAAIW